MDSSIFLILAAATLMGMIAIVVRTFGRSVENVVTLSMLVFLLFYGLRSAIFAFNLDAPFHQDLFSSSNLPLLATKTILAICLFLLALGVGVCLTGAGSSPHARPLFLESPPSMNRMWQLSSALTLVSVATTGLLIVRHGGVGGMITAVKIENELAGLYVLKVPLIVGAVTSAATVIDLRRYKRGHQARQAIMLFCALLNAVLVFAWGQRSVVVVVLAMLALSEGRGVWRKTRILHRGGVRVALAVILVVAGAAGLRAARDTLTRGDVQDIYAEATIWRKMSLGTNATYFDAAMLAFRDWPTPYAFREGEDFRRGMAGPVPRLLWPDKPTAIVPGKWFRQVYQPNVDNGWPVGSPAVWYMNFGYTGLAIGGTMSGIALGWIARRQRAAYPSGLNTGIALIIAVYVLQLGWSSDTPLRVAYWLVPFLGIVWWLERNGQEKVADRRVSCSEGRVRQSIVPNVKNAGSLL